MSYVAQNLDIEDLSAFSRSCRAIHTIVTPSLYRLVKDEAGLMCWAVDEGQEGTVAHLLAAGANPNIAWVQSCSRSAGLRLLETCRPFMRPSSSGSSHEAESPQDETDLPIDSPSPVFPLDEDEDDDSLILFPSDEDEDDDSLLLLSDEDEEDGSSHVGNTEPGTGRFDLASQYYWTPLHIASRWGNNDIINLLLRYGADVNAFSRGFCDCHLPKETPQPLIGSINSIAPIWTPLHTAICHGHEESARLLICRGASTNVSPRSLGSDTRHVTALHTACYSDTISICRFLINEGYQPDVDVQDHTGSTPMSYAYFAGSWASIDFLMETGASLNANLGPFTLLKHACYEGRFAEALRFIELGVDIDASFEHSGGTESILHCCCMPRRGNVNPYYHRESSQEYLRAEILRALIKAGANLEARDRDSMTPLIKASLFSIDTAVEVLLAEGADINARDSSGDTALLRACAPRGLIPDGAMLRTITTLLAHTPPQFDTFEALERVCGSAIPNEDRVDVLQLLIRRGDPTILDSNKGRLLLLRGLNSCNFELCDTLLHNGLREPTSAELRILIPKAMAKDNSRALEYISKLPHGSEALKNPLHVLNAIKRGKSECAAFLIEAGAPTTLHAHDDENCLIEACKLEDPTVAKLLLEKGADPNETVGNSSPLIYPIFNGNIAMIELLLDYGAIMHAPQKGFEICERTFGPLDFAIFLGREEVVETMVHHDSYFESTEEDRVTHLAGACCVDAVAFGDGTILDTLLNAGDIDPDSVFSRMNATPLHVSVALGRVEAVRYLVAAGANIHYIPRPIEPSVPQPAPNPFAASTPLELAIDDAPIQIIEEMLNNSHDKPFEDPDVPLLRYVRAACRRHKPEVMEVLLNIGMDPNTSDEAGNPFLSIFCQTIDKIWPLGDLDWPASKIAQRSADCVVVLLAHGADPLRKNTEGVSALDNIRRMMTYNGPCDFHQEVVRSWNRKLILDETGVREKHTAFF
ncbi:ankyrin [Hypoxylon sp. EC38]|nr:ankyrin [Hypoxylon sp. EC38]